MEERRPEARLHVLVFASMTLSVISLFVAISGAATAGSGKVPPNSVGTKELKPGAVTAPDVAKNAITTKALASSAVQPPDIARGAVTTPAMAPNAVTAPTIANGAVTTGKLSEKSVTEAKIGPNAVASTNLQNEAVTAAKIGPRAVSVPALSIPELSVHAANVPVDVPMGDCQGTHFVSFSAVRSNPSSMFSGSQPTDLVAPIDGVYSLGLTMSWSNSDGYVRAAYVSRARGAALDVVGLPAEAPGPVGYGQRIDGGTYELQAGDALRVAPVACAVGMTPETAPTLDSFDAQLKWVAQPES
jgi:hypothetical protein